jgi:hypothetical protein
MLSFKWQTRINDVIAFHFLGSWIGDSNFWKSHNPKLISYLKVWRNRTGIVHNAYHPHDTQLGYELILENGEILSPDTHLDKAIPGRKAVIVADSSYTATLSNIARWLYPRNRANTALSTYALLDRSSWWRTFYECSLVLLVTRIIADSEVSSGLGIVMYWCMKRHT